MKYLRNSTLKFYTEKCTGCGRCAEVCPHGVFEMNDKKASLKFYDRCMECGACAKNCAFDAISVNAGVGCASAVITGLLRGIDPVCGCDSSSGCC